MKQIVKVCVVGILVIFVSQLAALFFFNAAVMSAVGAFCELRERIPLFPECEKPDNDNCVNPAAAHIETVRDARRSRVDETMPPAALYPAGTTYETLDERQLEHAQIIIQTGIDVGVPENGLVVAIAAAMQESKLYMYANSSAYPDSLDYPHDFDGSDHDSLGLFQQRPQAGWGSVAELMDPAYSAKAFYGGKKGPNNGSPRGLLDIPGWQEMSVAEAAQSVQVSAYPDAYAQWETMARDTVAAISGDGGVGDHCNPDEGMSCPNTDAIDEEGLTPDAIRVGRCLDQKFSNISEFYGTTDAKDHNDDHPPGRAVDATLSHQGDGDEIAAWLVENAGALGVEYIVWGGEIWSDKRSGDGWRPYDPPGKDDGDWDHLHVSVHGNAAGTPDTEWVVPVKGEYTITARFGMSGEHWQNSHTGVDLAAPTGRPIVAAARGTVAVKKDLGGRSYGRYLVIAHDDGVSTWYCHMSKFAGVKVGDSVTAGQVIGYIGASGNVTGPHLHFEVRTGGGNDDSSAVDGVPVDPEPWMKSHQAKL